VSAKRRFGRSPRRLTSCSAASRSAPQARATRPIGLRERSGRRGYPLFQFHDGRPLDALIAAFYTVTASGLDEWSGASWCVRPDPALDGDSPVQWTKTAKDPERLAQVVRQDARRFAQ
jgi:hypothetical protein